MFILLDISVYTNTLFATLNARNSAAVGMPDDTENGTGSMSMSRIRARATEFDNHSRSRVRSRSRSR